MGLIADAVAFARRGENEKVISRMPSGWAVMGDVQFLPGYCVLVPDPVVATLAPLLNPKRSAFSTLRCRRRAARRFDRPVWAR